MLTRGVGARDVSLIVVAAVAGICYGLLHELGDTSTALDYSVAACSLIVAAVVTAIPIPSNGPSLALAIPIVVSAWVIAVLGDILPFALQLGSRTIQEYSQSDALWWILLTFNLFAFFFAAVIAGLAAALLSWAMAAIARRF